MMFTWGLGLTFVGREVGLEVSEIKLLGVQRNCDWVHEFLYSSKGTRQGARQSDPTRYARTKQKLGQ